VIEDLDLLVKNDGASEDDKEKPNIVVETAKVIEDLDLLLAVEKCACTAIDQVPVLVFDHLSRKDALENDMVGVKEEVKLEENDAHLNIFKIDLDQLEVVEFGNEEEPKVNIFKVDFDNPSSSLGEPEGTDRTQRERPARLPLTSVRCGGLTTELQREEKKRHGAEFARKEAESEEKGAKGENDEAGVSGYQPVRVKRVDLVQKNKTMPFKVNKGGGEEPQRVMVTVPYKMPVRISKEDTGEVPVPMNRQALPYQLPFREVPQQVPRSLALEGEASLEARPITS